jgi:hypothetical protein
MYKIITGLLVDTSEPGIWQVSGIRALAVTLVFMLLLGSGAISPKTTGYYCTVLYFFNGIVVRTSQINETLLLETPRNLTLEEGFTQEVYHLISYNVVYNETAKAFAFNVSEAGYFEGFFVSKVVTCTRPFGEVSNYVSAALRNPRYMPPISGEIPESTRSYLREPYSKVVEVVKPAYESWFRGLYNFDVREASILGIAVTAAYFIYGGFFIKYDPSALPRSIDEVLEQKRGDCDDMSRVLIELLNAYGIPALMATGYTYISGFNYTAPIENVTYRFIGNGPHGYVVAYIPGLGWVSLDFLAGSLLERPFVFDGYTRETSVSREALKEFVDIHKRINATQVIAVFTEDELSRALGSPLTLKSALEYFNVVVKGEVSERATTTIVTQESIETSVETATSSSPITEETRTTHQVTTPSPEAWLPTLLILLAALAVAAMLIAKRAILRR